MVASPLRACSPPRGTLRAASRCCMTGRQTEDRCPDPTFFVVKNGSKMRSTCSNELSRHRCRARSLRRRTSFPQRSWSRARISAQFPASVSDSAPRSAWYALTSKFMKTCLSCIGIALYIVRQLAVLVLQLLPECFIMGHTILTVDSTTLIDVRRAPARQSSWCEKSLAGLCTMCRIRSLPSCDSRIALPRSARTANRHPRPVKPRSSALSRRQSHVRRHRSCATALRRDLYGLETHSPQIDQTYSDI